MVFTTEDYLQLCSIMILRYFFLLLARVCLEARFPRFRRHSSFFAFSIKGRTRKKIANFLPVRSRHAAGSKSRKKNGTDKVTRDCLPFSCRVITPRSNVAVITAYHAVVSHVRRYRYRSDELCLREKDRRVFRSFLS